MVQGAGVRSREFGPVSGRAEARSAISLDVSGVRHSPSSGAGLGTWLLAQRQVGAGHSVERQPKEADPRGDAWEGPLAAISRGLCAKGKPSRLMVRRIRSDGCAGGDDCIPHAVGACNRSLRVSTFWQRAQTWPARVQRGGDRASSGNPGCWCGLRGGSRAWGVDRRDGLKSFP